MSADVRSGSCLCGAVTFEVTLPSKWCAHCHCSRCQRAHGAGFVTWFGVPAPGFRVTAGESELVRYVAPSDATRSFCGRCGSSMFFESPRWPDEVHVTLANLRGDLDRAPQAHVYWETHVDWAQPGDGLPRKPSTGAT